MAITISVLDQSPIYPGRRRKRLFSIRSSWRSYLSGWASAGSGYPSIMIPSRWRVPLPRC